MKKLEIDLQACPMKAVVTSNTIDLMIKRKNENWKRAVSIKAAKKNVCAPWSVRWWELGTAKYSKLSTWESVKSEIEKIYMVTLPDHAGDSLLPKITMMKMLS